MTEYEQRVTIGELVECHPQIQWNAVSPDGTATCMTGETRKEVEKWLSDLPKDSWAKDYHVQEWKIYRNYPRDLNAMHEAEKAITDDQWPKYRDLLNEMAFKACPKGIKWFRPQCCTAAQRAEAFLRVKGLWKD